MQEVAKKFRLKLCRNTNRESAFSSVSIRCCRFPEKKFCTSRSRRIFDNDLPSFFCEGRCWTSDWIRSPPLPFERGRPSRWQKSKKSLPLSPPTNTSHPSYSSLSLLHCGAAAALQIGFPSFSPLCDPLLLLLFPLFFAPMSDPPSFPLPQTQNCRREGGGKLPN